MFLHLGEYYHKELLDESNSVVKSTAGNHRTGTLSDATADTGQISQRDHVAQPASGAEEYGSILRLLLLSIPNQSIDRNRYARRYAS